MACRVAGAGDVDEFWRLLCRGESVLGNARAGGPDGAVLRGGAAALMDRIDLFDAEFFGVSPRQAAAMDPQQRHLLELSWHALEHAGIAPGSIAGGEVGVFVAASSYDYRERAVGAGKADGYATIGTLPTFLANRISYAYDLHGPSMVIDTACSAGLTVVNAAVSALERGECSIALVGAVNLLCNGFNDAAFRQAGMLSPTGELRAFDDRADGYVRGEGAGWIVLRRLGDAVEAGDLVHAVVRGTAVNHGGRAASLTSPNISAQADVVRAALRRAGVDAQRLGYLEAHGTGTPLGDPIEVEALRSVLEDDRRCSGPDGRLWLGTVKANIGHLEGAAGLLGLIKAALVVRHGSIPELPGFQRRNPEVKLSGSPLAVLDRTVAWPSDQRLAAVSSFGIGGSNAHVIVEQAPELPDPVASDPMGHVFPLSAHSPAALRALASALAARAPGRPDAMAWTLQTGRDALERRCLIFAQDQPSLLAALRAVAAGEEHPDVAYAPHELDGPRTMLAPWLSGDDLDWRALWTCEPPRRTPLAPYPFSGASYWLEDGPAREREPVQELVTTWRREPSPAPEASDGPSLIVHDERTAAMAERLRRDATGDVRLCAVDDVAALDGADVLLLVGGARWTVDDGGRRVRRWLHAIAALGSPARLRLVTTGMVDPTGNERVPAGATLQGALVGAVRTLPHERPTTRIAVVDAPAGDVIDPAVLTEPTSGTAAVAALRPEGRYRQSWRPRDGEPDGPAPGGAYLILGGAGGVGAHLAHSLVTQYQASVLLVGRSEENRALTDRLRAAGTVHYRRGDLSRPGTAAELLAECRRLFGRVDGVIHAAGTVRDALVQDLTEDDLDAVLSIKVDATLELHEAMRAECPDASLFLCSSIVGALGSRGGFAYAAANSFLGCFAEAAGDGPAVRAVDWGVWRDTGLGKRFGRWIGAAHPGLMPLDPADGVAAAWRCLGGGAAHSLVVAGDPSTVLATVTASAHASPEAPPVLAAEPEARAPEAAATSDVAGAIVRIVATMTGGSRPDTDVPWQEIGVDSLLTIELAARLAEEFGPLKPTDLFEYPTIDALAAHLSGRMRPAPVRPAVVPERPADTAIAVIGLAADLPGAPDVDALWRLLSEGRSPVQEVPADRWDWRVARTVTGSYTRWGCFLDGWDRFDPELFRILPRDAAAMDPQERLFLRTAVEALEVGGYGRPALRGRRVGVFAGVTANSHLLDQRDRRGRGAENPEYAVTALSSVANRVSYVLDLAGPSIAVDTMCSSSLTALHLACMSLASGESELAVAGGVNLYLHPDRFAALCALGMPSHGDRTRAFGAGGDGFVPGEGAVAVVLKPLAAALADGDTVHGVIAGTGVNHGGRAGGYTVPNPVAQAALVERTLDEAGVSPSTIGYVEAHGTGTELGDPIELRALSKVFDGAVNVPIGSIKSNLGHSEAAAGLAGLVKILLQLRHGRLVRTLWADQENPLLELEATPFRLQRADDEWPRGRTPRRAAISSFGAGGSNAHAVVEAPPEPVRSTPSRGSAVVVPLSGPDAEHLRRTAETLHAALTTDGPTVYAGRDTALEDIAHTLSVGREVWPHRAAIVCRDHDELIAGLAALAEGRPHESVVRDAGQAGIAGEWVRDGGPPPLSGGRRVPLPPTPSIGRGLTVEAPEPERSLPARALPFVSAIRPAPAEVGCRVAASDPWFGEHVLDGEPVLAGAFGAELVLEALLASGVSPFHVELHDLTWPVPVRRAPAELRACVTPTATGFDIAVHEGERIVVKAEARAHETAPPEASPIDLTGAVDGAACYEAFRRHGFDYGERMRPVRRFVRDGRETVAELRIPEGVAAGDRALLHPVLLDGATQVAALPWMQEAPPRSMVLRPLSVRRVRLYRPAEGTVFVRARSLGDSTGTSRTADIVITDERGRLVAELERFLVIVHGTGEAKTSVEEDLAAYRMDWADAPLPASQEVPQEVPAPMVIDGTALEEPVTIDGPADVLIDLTGLDLSLGTVRGDASRYQDVVDTVLLPLFGVLRALMRARISGQIVILAKDDDEPLLRGLYGLVTTAASETAKAHFRLVGVPSGMGRADVLDEFGERGSGRVRRYEDGRRRRATLVEEPLSAAVDGPRPDGRYVITGGLGGLSRAIAADLLRRCPEATVTLLGRSAPDPAALAGLPAHYVQCDVADRDAVEQALAGLRPTGVIHTAGVLHDGFLRGKQPEHVEQVLRPKVLGALVLDAALADADLDFFVVISSVAAVIGNQGQSDYSLANGFLDGFAAGRGGPGRTLSVGLPLLDGGGMRPTPEALSHLESVFGMRALPVASAAARLWDLLAADRPHLVLVRGDQDRWRSVVGVTDHRADPEPASEPAPEPASDPAVTRWLTERLAEVTGILPDGIDPARPFEDYGIDSLAIMRLNRLLENTVGGVAHSLAFDHATIAELAHAMLDTHGEAVREALGTTAPAPARTQPDAGDGDVPLGARQTGIWLVDQAAGRHTPYNISLAWRLPTGVDLAALTSAVEDLPRRHPVLAARLTNTDGSLQVSRGTGTAVSRQRIGADELHAAIRREADRRFRLAEEPPWRGLLWLPDGERPVLQIVTHHAVVDGRSAEILPADLAAGYRAALDGRRLEPVRPDFLDYLAAEPDPRPGLPEIESVWSSRLKDIPAAPRFTDGDPDAPRYAGGHRELRLRGDLPAASASGLFPTLLGAFALAVARRTGSTRMVVAVPTYGRPDTGYDDTIGCFTNSVPIMVTVDPERPVDEWLRTLRDDVRAALALPEYPYPHIVQLCRELGGDDAVPTLSFTLHNWASRGAADTGPLSERVFRRGQQGHYDLAVEVGVMDGELDLLVSHRLGALRTGAVDEVIDDLRRLSWRLGRDGGSVGDLLSGRQDTLHGRFLRRALADPEHIVVSDGRVRLSNAEVARRSAAIASWLDTRAAASEPVGVLLERGAHLPVALLGVLRSGRPYVPLDAAYPAPRQELILRAAGCRIVLTEPDLAGSLPPDVTAALVDDVIAAPGHVHEDAGSGEDPAYLMFTSGSTGTPKGVQVSHHNVLHLLDSIGDLVGWRPGHCLLALTTACFDISVLELFLPIVGGGRVHVGDRATALDARRFTRVMDEENVDLVQATPSGWRLLLDGGWTGRPGLTALCGGEALPQVLADDLARRVSALWNVYGPTETTIWSTAVRLRPGQPVHLGDPIGVTDLLIAGEPGGVGELWIGGLGTASGYWRQPELTAERFGGHPTAPESGGRYFRTGDLVRREPDGRLVFLGREDTQVKVRGHRVELAEIERVLGGCPGLAGVVVRCDGSDADAELVAIAVPAPGHAPPNLRAVRDFAAERLPSWMLPDVLELRETFPLTPNGKVDRLALATREERDHESVQKDAGADLSERVLACWHAVLGERDIAPGRTFFAAGGTSMQLTRLQTALEAEFPGQRIDVADLFDNPTPAQQAALLGATVAPGPAPVTNGAVPAGPAVLDRRARRAALRQEAGAR